MKIVKNGIEYIGSPQELLEYKSLSQKVVGVELLKPYFRHAERRSNNLSQALRNAWANKSPEERAVWSEKMRMGKVKI